MDNSEIIALVGGVALMAGTYWYFFGQHEKTAAKNVGGVQEITIQVKGGYSPDTIVVKQGIPVRLNFQREEEASCSERVIIADFGIVRDLPAFQTTAVEFTPDKAGEFSFTCGMNMLHGKLIVQATAPKKNKTKTA